MPRRPRPQPTQLDLEWTVPPRWAEVPDAVRDEIRAQLRTLLMQAADAERRAPGGRDE